MSDNELDNLFKEAADGFKAPNDPSAWQAMASKLDQAAVATSFWNWKTISSMALVGAVLVALVVYVSVSDSTTATQTGSEVALNQVLKYESAESKRTEDKAAENKIAEVKTPDDKTTESKITEIKIADNNTNIATADKN